MRLTNDAKQICNSHGLVQPAEVWEWEWCCDVSSLSTGVHLQFPELCCTEFFTELDSKQSNNCIPTVLSLAADKDCTHGHFCYIQPNEHLDLH